MKAADVMTRNLVSVPPDATVADAVKTMLDRGVSGLFVVDSAGELAGVLTEGDLMRREELGTERHRPWWLRMLVSPGRQAADFTHAHSRRVADVMTRQVFTVDVHAPLPEVVECMERHRIKRVPVRESGRMVGVITRSDLLRVLASTVRAGASPSADDRTIRSTILDALQDESWAPCSTVNVTVVDGVADLWGTITSEEERRAICVLAENTPGVAKVNDHLVYLDILTGTVIEPPGARG